MQSKTLGCEWAGFVTYRLSGKNAGLEPYQVLMVRGHVRVLTAKLRLTETR